MRRSVIAITVGLVGLALGVGIAGWPDRVPNDVVIEEAVTTSVAAASTPATAAPGTTEPAN